LDELPSDGGSDGGGFGGDDGGGDVFDDASELGPEWPPLDELPSVPPPVAVAQMTKPPALSEWSELHMIVEPAAIATFEGPVLPL